MIASGTVTVLYACGWAIATRNRKNCVSDPGRR